METCNRKSRDGFTLMEMIVVIAIISILMSVLIPSFTHIQKMARQARAQELVSNAATALSLYLQREQYWHKDIIDSGGEFNHKVCKVLFDAGLLDVTARPKVDDKTGLVSIDPKDYSLDKFGLLDPWGQVRLARKKEWLNASSVDACQDPPTKFKLRDHLLQFRIDSDFDGFVGPSDLWGGAPLGKKVRASAIVWSRGPKGKDDTTGGGQRFPHENRLSWTFGN